MSLEASSGGTRMQEGEASTLLDLPHDLHVRNPHTQILRAEAASFCAFSGRSRRLRERREALPLLPTGRVMREYRAYPR